LVRIYGNLNHVTLYSVIYINQFNKCTFQEREKENIISCIVLLFLQSITYINQHFEEAAAEEGKMKGQKQLKKSKVVNINSRKSWEQYITDATTKGFPVSLIFFFFSGDSYTY